ncbi:hypothetical protein ZIOFF_073469 [Zingiber officinale]|uniref:RRM domain-containing protein n=1 Tax=Zingiber officinale TaxID=94328 RepID=A0A8J5C0E6_ZINOF|nr:hypothetical protein ZIOFF_073469 [Zingiber officinale]
MGTLLLDPHHPTEHDAFLVAAAPSQSSQVGEGKALSSQSSLLFFVPFRISSRCLLLVFLLPVVGILDPGAEAIDHGRSTHLFASFAPDTEVTPCTGTTASRIQLRLPLVSSACLFHLAGSVGVQNAEENNTVENYSNPEAPQQLPVLDERLGESFAEETMPYPIALETTRDPPLATAEEPVGEPTKRTYASIVCKSQSSPSMHPTLVIKTSLVVSEQTHSFSQHSHPAIFPENSGSKAIEEALVVEDEVDSRYVYVGNLPSSISTSDLEQVFKNFGKLRPDGVFIRSRKVDSI